MDESEDRGRMPWWSRAAGKVLIAAMAVALVAAVAVAKFSDGMRSALAATSDTSAAPDKADRAAVPAREF